MIESSGSNEFEHERECEKREKDEWKQGRNGCSCGRRGVMVAEAAAVPRQFVFFALLRDA